MDKLQCENYFSAKRFNRYLRAVNYDENCAYELYKLQEDFSGEVHALLACFEVVFRNQINKRMSEYNPDWLLDLSLPGSKFQNPKTKITYKMLDEARQKLEKKDKLTNDDIVAIVYFGFWTALFQRKQLALLDDLPLEAFTHRPNLEKLRLIDKIHGKLNQCRQTRNLVAHLEPIIFKSDSCKLDFSQVQHTIINVLQLSEWLGIDPVVYKSNITQINDSIYRITKLTQEKVTPSIL